MSRIGIGVGALVISLTALVAGCAESEDTNAALPAAGTSALTRIVPEAAGANCPAGGQAIRFGVDRNGSGLLDDDEVTGVSYVCNGTSSSMSTDLVPILPGDPRCPDGGMALTVVAEPGAPPKEIAACNGSPGGRTGAQGPEGQRGPQGAPGQPGAVGTPGAQGPQGAQGAQGPQGVPGAQGPQGVQGPAGPAAPEPRFGQFLGSQIVKGVVATCTTTAAAATTVECRGLKLNGLDVRLHPTDANVICQAITGKGYDTASGLGVVAAPYVAWNATATSWELVTSGNVSPMQNLTCKR